MSDYKGPQDKLELYDKLIASHPDIDRKGKTNPYTSLNGHMFSHLSKEGTMGLRLSKEDQEAFLAEHDSGPYIQYGATMRGYVSIPDKLLQDTEAMMVYLEKSRAYIASLEPKPTKKKK